MSLLLSEKFYVRSRNTDSRDVKNIIEITWSFLGDCLLSQLPTRTQEEQAYYSPSDWEIQMALSPWREIRNCIHNPSINNLTSDYFTLGILANIWRHIWLSLLLEEGSLGIKWVEIIQAMKINALQYSQDIPTDVPTPSGSSCSGWEILT